MREWKNTGRVGIGIAFRDGEAACKLGEAAIAERRVYLQFDDVSSPHRVVRVIS